MVRMPLVLRRIRTDTPRTSETSEVVCRFGRNRRRVLFLAWLTLLPLITPLPVTWQRRAMALSSEARSKTIAPASLPGRGRSYKGPHRRRQAVRHGPSSKRGADYGRGALRVTITFHEAGFSLARSRSPSTVTSGFAIGTTVF